MEKPQTELDWHKLHRFDELPKAQQQAVVRLVNTLASYHRNAEMNNQQLADLISGIGTLETQKHGLLHDIANVNKSIEEYKELQSYTKELGLDFIVSCWDIKSLDLVEEHLDVKYHKIASAMATDKEFLEKLNDTGKPVILSVGMCNDGEVSAAMSILLNVKYILACTSTYPTRAEEINLRYIETLKKLYPTTKVGFSNHYNGLDACVGSIIFGAECVEFHITKDRTMYGSDQVASIQHSDDLVDSIRKMELMVGDGIKKVYDSEVPIAAKLRKVTDTI